MQYLKKISPRSHTKQHEERNSQFSFLFVILRVASWKNLFLEGYTFVALRSGDRQLHAAPKLKRVRILNMNNSARQIPLNFRRGMNEQWTHSYYTSAPYDAISCFLLTRRLENLFICQHAIAV